MPLAPARRPAGRPLRAAGAVLLAAALLAGCGTPRAGAAATVGPDRISEADLAAATNELRSLVGDPTGDTSETLRSVLARMVTRDLAEAAVRRAGLTVPGGDVDRARRDLTTEVGGEEQLARYAAEAGVPPRLVDDVLYTSIALELLGRSLEPEGTPEEQQGAALLALAELSIELGVVVNPRYGVWLPANGAIGPPPDDLSVPAAG